ncbi:hypothetical protein DAI22_12g115500 [Oryza sativa Japonica Group]|nr:hypothetical protein DAI22_12g115500 [Oryza sativa Japonica Group]
MRPSCRGAKIMYCSSLCRCISIPVEKKKRVRRLHTSIINFSVDQRQAAPWIYIAILLKFLDEKYK